MPPISRYILSGMQILLDQKWVENQAVVVEGKIIKAIIPANMTKHHLPAKHFKFDSTHLLVPGFIDLHIHGANNHDVMDGTAEGLLEISHALAIEGVTSFLATTMNSDNEHIEQILKLITEIRKVENNGAGILGIHLEGPFISQAKMGAQRGQEQIPDSNLFKKWQSIAEGGIKIVTLAPELPGAREFIKTLKDMNVIASIGHTNAKYEECIEAINAGCTQATHLFNAMRGIHQREPGAAGALLLSNKIFSEVIVDGLHLHPAIIDLILRLKHKDHVLLVTDAMRAKCMGDGTYELGGHQVQVQGQRVELQDGTLAGSVLRMPEAIQNMMKFTKCSLIDAIDMATRNPAHVLGIGDRKGIIEVGKDADLVVMSHQFEVLFSMREGKELYNNLGPL